MPVSKMKYAICNETFEGWEWERICALSASLGYEGLEVAPFTLATHIGQVTPDARLALRRTADRHGLKIIGLHWLLAKTEGFWVTSPNPSVRVASAAYLGELAQACSDLGGDLMVFGSPLQRKIPSGHSREEADDFFLDTLNRLKPHLEKTGVKLLLEPLAPSETDYLQTAREAELLLDLLNHPLFGLHLDVKAMAADEAPPDELIMRHAARMGHFHANDANRKAPGMGETNFVPILKALTETNYSGYVSIEVFDYSPDPETIAREGLAYLRACEKSA